MSTSYPIKTAEMLSGMGIELKTHLPDIKDGLLRAYVQSASTFPQFAVDYLNQRNAVNVEITSFRYRQRSYFFLHHFCSQRRLRTTLFSSSGGDDFI